MRTIATFAVAIFLGVVAVLLTRGYVSSVTQRVGTPTGVGALVPVVVAAQALERGVVLQPASLKVVNFPAEAAPANVFHAVSDLTGGKDQQRLVLRSLVANEPILPSYVSGPGGKLNLSGTIAAGMRAVSFRSTDVTGVGGFVLPGDRVDVLLTRNVASGGNTSNTLTQVLAENVRVLGVDQSANDEADKPVVTKAITVEVLPEQASAISLGQSVGIITLTLRHVADDTPLAQKTMDVRDLGPAPKKASGGPAAPAIRVIRGTDSSRFSLNGSSMSGATAGVTDAASSLSRNTAAGLGRAAAQAPGAVGAGVTTP
jgi:pilus assembly protein CpaB